MKTRPSARGLYPDDTVLGDVMAAPEPLQAEPADASEGARCPACGAAAVYRAWITIEDQHKLLSKLGPPIQRRSRGPP